MTNDQAARLLRGIYDVAMSCYPMDDHGHSDLDPRYVMALGYVAGSAIEGINAVNEERNIRRTNFDPPRSARIRES